MRRAYSLITWAALVVGLPACGGSGPSHVDPRDAASSLDVAGETAPPGDAASDVRGDGTLDTMSDAMFDSPPDATLDTMSDAATDAAIASDATAPFDAAFDAAADSDGALVDVPVTGDAAGDTGPSLPDAHDAAVDAPPAAIAVHGAVRDVYGFGVPGYKLLLVGSGATTTSAGDGTFAFQNVVSPYTLAVRSPWTRLTIQIYDGLDAREPVLAGSDPTLDQHPEDPIGVAGRAGYSSARIALPDDSSASMVFATNDPSYVGQAIATSADGSVLSLQVAWRGSAALSGTVWYSRVHCASASDCASSDLEAASPAVMLSPGAVVAPPLVTTLPAIANHHTAGVTTTGPACSNMLFAFMSYLLPGDIGLGMFRVNLPVATWTLSDPPPGGTLRLDVTCITDDAYITARQRAFPPGGVASFALFNPPALAAPADGAMVTWPPSFSFAPSAGGSGVFLVGLFPETGGANVALYTTRTSPVLPALDALGFVPAAGERWLWQVVQDSGFPSVNAVVDGTPAPASAVRTSGADRLLVVR